MTNLMDTQTRAASLGYTVPVLILGGGEEIEGWVKPDTDYDDRFVVYSSDTGLRYGVNGWNCDTEEREA